MPVSARLLLGSFGGLGLLPLMPGTWGTAGAAAAAALLLGAVPQTAEHWPATCAAWVAAASLATLVVTPALEREGGKDPQVIVTDEVAGYWLTLAPLADPQPAHLVAAFFVFRFLDVVKPWPGRLLERLPGGWGVLLDDLVAGAYGALALWLVERFAG